MITVTTKHANDVSRTTGAGVPTPGKIIIAFVLLLATLVFHGCDTAPLQPDISLVDFWRQVIPAEQHVPVVGIVFNADNEMFVAEYGKGIAQYEQLPDESWVQADYTSMQDNEFTELHYDLYTGYLYAGTNAGRLYRSTNDGSTWSDVSPPDTSGTDLINHLAGITTSPFLELFVAKSAEGIYYSTDFGDTWQLIFAAPSVNGITTLAYSPLDELYVGTMREGMYRGSSFQGMPFWTVTLDFFNQITVVETDSAGTAFFGTHNGDLYSWGPDGFTYLWNDAGAKEPIMDILIAPTGGMFLSVYKHGVYHMANGGSSFGPVNDALYDRWVRSLAIDANGYVYAGTETEGIFKTVFPAQFYDDTSDTGDDQ